MVNAKQSVGLRRIRALQGSPNTLSAAPRQAAAWAP